MLTRDGALLPTMAYQNSNALPFTEAGAVKFTMPA